MVSDPCHNCQSGTAGELIRAKADALETSLLGDQLHKKANVARYFLCRINMLEPLTVVSQIEVSDGFDL